MLLALRRDEEPTGIPWSVTMVSICSILAMWQKLRLLNLELSNTAITSLAWAIMAWLSIASSMFGVEIPFSNENESTPRKSL